jgi:hypothetical protein
MKKAMFIGSALMLALIMGMPSLYAQQQGTPPQGSGWYCPWMAQGGGMHRGRGMGRCMMGRGGMMAPNLNQGQPLTKEQAKQLLENYVAYSNNPNLKLGAISDKGDVFEATVVTKDGSLVETIQVDKKTGWFRNVS